ncbi:hypothetical protein AGJ34_21875 [Cronobacter dublinensis subsp. dublinensis]|nr:hypothetical protein [Cronobacter dublinensis subsp. dublinensis]EGT5729664.1 hypothetical protein [Cronobacter dublinensis subsp. dublinensis]
MFKKSPTQKRIESLSKLMTNGYKFAVIDASGEIISTHRFKYELSMKPAVKEHKTVLLKDLFNEQVEKHSN